MRGAPKEFGVANRKARIIPAYAGSTIRTPLPHRHPWDHPRVCGEHGDLTAEQAKQPGSSPRMRGAPSILSGLTFFARIIPAYAGSTGWPQRLWSGCADHPRVCGEHGNRYGRLMVTGGSSPRMRGALQRFAQVNDVREIIPAYAGSTCLGWVVRG